MGKIKLSVDFDESEILEKIGKAYIIGWLRTHGYEVVDPKDLHKYIDVEKSMGTEPFYNFLVDSIEKGKLNLELLVGMVATKKLMATAQTVASKSK